MKTEALSPGEQEALKAKMAEHAKQFPVQPKKTNNFATAECIFTTERRHSMPIVHDPKTGQFAAGSGARAGGGKRVVVANIHMGSPKHIVQQGRGGRIFEASGKSPVTGQEIKALGRGPKGAEIAWLQTSAKHASQHLTRENWNSVTENIQAGKLGI